MNPDAVLDDLRSELLELGRFQMQGWQQLRTEQIHRKRDANGEESTVTWYDVESERRLRAFVESRFPDHSFLGEETGHLKRDPEHYWIVDPIDGTTNFTHSIPFWGPSIAYWHRGRPELAAIHFPALPRLYWARRGGGAFCDGERIQSSSTPQYSMQTIVALHSRTHLRPMKGLRAKLRIPGSIIANMCMVASGEFLASTGRGRLWDVAAGLLILEEAGAAVEVRPSIETLDLPSYADAPEEQRIFHLFAHGNEHLPSLQERFDAETSTH
jgi:myo-inositol-1(or 4)-monophosphatase